MSEVTQRYRLPAERGFVVKPQPHPDSVTTFEELIEVSVDLRDRGPLLADLFSGCGGLSLGAAAAGFVPVVAVDRDPLALETWRSLFPGVGAELDLGDPDTLDRLVDVLNETGVDAIVGGPPCQPFSRAGRSLLRHLVAEGRRNAHDERRELWRSFIDVVTGVRPSVVLMENVPELALGDDTLLVRTIVDELENLGYGVSTRIISSSDHGVPQFRQRIIIVGLRDGVEYSWPEPTLWHPTLRMAISDLPPVEPGWTRLGGEGGSDEYSVAADANPLLEWLREGVEPDQCERVFDHVTRAVRDDDLEIFEAMDSDTKYSDIEDRLKRYRDDIFDDKYKRLAWDQPSRSITAHLAKDGYWYIHPSQHRTLTIREAARIQTFPDRVRFAGPPSAALRQIGNAVPPLAAFHLLREARDSLERARHPAFSTGTTSNALRNWYDSRSQLSMPWIAVDSASAWQVIQAELLLPRPDGASVRAAWPVVERMVDVEQTLDWADRLRRVFVGNASDRLATVLEAAQWYAANPGDHFDHAETMAANPHVPSRVAQVAELVSCPAESPTITSAALLRVAARFFGSDVDVTNKGTDGRISIARLIGGSVFDETPLASRVAHLALIEIGNSVCTSKNPLCMDCPLSGGCSYADANPTLFNG